jgi:hypothetical protein
MSSSSLGASGGIKDITQFFDDLKIKSLEQENSELKAKYKELEEKYVHERTHRYLEMKRIERLQNDVCTHINKSAQYYLLLQEIWDGLGNEPWETRQKKMVSYVAIDRDTYDKWFELSAREDSDDDDDDDSIMDDDDNPKEPILPPIIPEDGIGMSKITEYLPTTSSTIGGTTTT